MLPLCVSIDDVEGRDLQIDMDDFYGRIANGGIPKSSQPPIGEVMEAYEKYSDAEIINIAMAATFASVLHLKPIMTQTPDGCRLDKYGVKRSMKLAVKAVIEHLKEKKLDAKHIIYVSHARAEEDAKKVVAMLKEHYADVEIQLLELGAAFVTQGGPQCIAIQYIEK